MMARSTTCSNQRPDTLMQDRICRIDENLLQRTAGPYIRVIYVTSAMSALCLLYPQLLTKWHAVANEAMRQLSPFAPQQS
jgi:hypothetical protein